MLCLSGFELHSRWVPLNKETVLIEDRALGENDGTFDAKKIVTAINAKHDKKRFQSVNCDFSPFKQSSLR